MHKWLALPPIASSNGAEIDQIIIVVHILMFLLFIGWGIYFVYALIRFSKSRNPKASYHGVKNHSSKYIEIAVAVFEAFLLVGFSIPIWASRVDDFPDEKDATVIHIVAEQFVWNAHYPGKDGIFGRTSPDLIDVQTNPLGLDSADPAGADDLTTIGEMNIPVDKPVIVKLSSKDVIHSFGVPLMRVKQDAVPGMTIPLWFKPIQEGQFEIVCSQLCGNGHYRMRGFINVQSEEAYGQWLNEKATAKVAPAAGGDSFWN